MSPARHPPSAMCDPVSRLEEWLRCPAASVLTAEGQRPGLPPPGLGGWTGALLGSCKARAPGHARCSPWGFWLWALEGGGHESCPVWPQAVTHGSSCKPALTVTVAEPGPLSTARLAAAAARRPAAGPRPPGGGVPGSCRSTPGSRPRRGCGRAAPAGRGPPPLRLCPRSWAVCPCRRASPGPWAVGTRAPPPARRPAPSSTPCRGRSRRPLGRWRRRAELQPLGAGCGPSCQAQGEGQETFRQEGGMGPPGQLRAQKIVRRPRGILTAGCPKGPLCAGPLGAGEAALKTEQQISVPTHRFCMAGLGPCGCPRTRGRWRVPRG